MRISERLAPCVSRLDIEFRHGHASDERGFALLMVLWVVVLLGVLSLNFLGSQRWNSAGVRNLKEETISHYLALSGYHEALNYILSDKDMGFDFIDSEGNFRVDKETPSVTGSRTVEGGEITIKILDEDSRININLAPPERLKKLFSYAGIADDAIIELNDCILDWKDPDGVIHLSGVEDEYYESLDEPYKTKNGSFDVPEELLLVKGMKPEFLYGSQENKGIISLITTFGKGSVNINTVTREYMDFMGLDGYEIEAILKQRADEAGGFRSIPPQFAAKGFNAVSTGTFRIEVTGRAEGGRLASTITAVLSRQNTAKGLNLQTLYWSENAKNIRT